MFLYRYYCVIYFGDWLDLTSLTLVTLVLHTIAGKLFFWFKQLRTMNERHHSIYKQFLNSKNRTIFNLEKLCLPLHESWKPFPAEVTLVGLKNRQTQNREKVQLNKKNCYAKIETFIALLLHYWKIAIRRKT